LILKTLSVFLGSLLLLGWHYDQYSIATAYSDPVAHIRAQDESEYVHSSLRMAREGDWLNPHVLGRLYLLKPPLLMWMTAASLRLFGASLFAVRFPALLLGAAGCAAVFLWVARSRSLAAGLLAGAVLALNPLWGILSRLCYTDTLAASFGVLGLLAVVLDPRLERGRTFVLFGTCAGASILAKGIAGLLPCAALVLYAGLLRDRGPKLGRVALCLGIAALVSVPWHAYQFLVHRQWFLADYVYTQIIASGVYGTEAGIFDRPALFYAQRLLQMDPLMTVLFLVGLAGVVPGLRRRDDPAALLATCWLGMAVLALAVFRVRNAPYLALALPPLGLIAGLGAPRWLRTWQIAGLLAIALAAKTGFSGPVWSLRPAVPSIPSTEALRRYADLRRDAELVDIDPDDEYYSATLSLPKVRYVYLDPAGSIVRSAPHYAYLGITLSLEEFLRLDQNKSQFARRWMSWGAIPPDGLGTTITVRDIVEAAQLIENKPESDFFVPDSWLRLVPASHEVLRISPGRVFLLSRKKNSKHLQIQPIDSRW
jgi:Dolichyl-phosphate-mannose-protein mannosyltransferase